MRRRSWAWAAEQRPATAPKARRWPRRRPRSRAARGSEGVCGSFTGTPVRAKRAILGPLGLTRLLIIKELSGDKSEKRATNGPLTGPATVRGLAPWFHGTAGVDGIGGAAEGGGADKWVGGMGVGGRKNILCWRDSGLGGGVEGCFLTGRRGGAEAAEIIGLLREAEALFWKEETRQWRISTGHNALRWRASSASGAAHGYSEALARRFRRCSRTFRI